MSGYFDILWEWNYMAQDKIWGANDEFMFAYAEFKERIKWPKWDVLEVIKYLLGAQEEYNWGIGKRLRVGWRERPYNRPTETHRYKKWVLFHGNQTRFECHKLSDHYEDWIRVHMVEKIFKREKLPTKLVVKIFSGCF